MENLNFFKLTQIIMDKDRCIQWCKEHNLLAPSIQCPRSEVHSGGHDEAHRETGTSGVAQEKAAMDVHLSARSLGFLAASSLLPKY